MVDFDGIKKVITSQEYDALLRLEMNQKGLSMKQFCIPKDVFWIKKGDLLKVVKLSGPEIYKLEGIAAAIFLSIANNSKEYKHSDLFLINRVLSDLNSLSLISPA